MTTMQERIATADATPFARVAAVLCDTCGERPRKHQRRACARCLWLGQDQEKRRARARRYKRRLRYRLSRPALFRSDRQDWATPPELFAQWHGEFGFTLDVCAHADNHKLPRWCGPGGEAPDGLAVPWAGERCWMNPPYGREIARWTAKAASEAGRGALVVALVPARTDTAWWHRDVLGAGAEVRYLPGRIRFVGAQHAAPFPSALVIWRGAEVRP